MLSNFSRVYGNSYYTVVGGTWNDALTWAECEQASRMLGGNLATIETAEENQFLYGDAGQAYIGIYKDEGGQWQWASGAAVSFTAWAYDFARQNSGFGSLLKAAYGSSNSWYEVNNSGQGIAEIPLTLSITRTGTVKEGAGIFTTSINLSAGTISNLANVNVCWKVTGITTDDLDSGSLTGSGTITNGKLDLQHSLKVDPDTAEQFAVSVYSDPAMQIGNTSSVAVEEQTVTSGGGSGVGGGGSGGGSSDTGGSGGSTPPTAPIGGGGGGSGGIGNLPAAELKPSSIDQIDDITRRAGLQATTLKSVENVMIMETAVTPNSADADRITGFSGRTDVVALNQEVVDQQSIIFASAKTQKAFNKQLKGSSNLIYNQRTGELVYDANGRRAGLGDTGGVLAVFEERPGLGKNNFVLLAPDVFG